MSVTYRARRGGQIPHRSAQVVMLIAGAALLTVLVVLALLSLAGWL